MGACKWTYGKNGRTARGVGISKDERKSLENMSRPELVKESEKVTKALSVLKQDQKTHEKFIQSPALYRDDVINSHKDAYDRNATAIGYLQAKFDYIEKLYIKAGQKSRGKILEFKR